jgi:hypothetical protein
LYEWASADCRCKTLFAVRAAGSILHAAKKTGGSRASLSNQLITQDLRARSWQPLDPAAFFVREWTLRA